MEKIINVPEGIRKLSEWTDFEKQLDPSHKKIILDKQIPGCGATTYFLEAPYPLILCGHRSGFLETKANSPRHVGKVHLFKKATDKTKEQLEHNMARLHYYISKCYSERIPPKILVTPDSLDHVLEVLQEDGVLQDFTLVSDECQCLLTDAPFKSETLLEYTLQLEQLKRVIYMSATPLENYLRMIPSQYSDIGQLPYYKLIWPEDMVVQPSIKLFEVPSLRKAAIKIIRDFQQNGYFERNYYHTATQAVFFFNSVGEVKSIVETCGLDPADVNVICAKTDDNSRRLAKGKIPLSIGKAPQQGMPHKTYTFVTKCSFEGDDFYHTNAMTYIFGDPNLDHLLIDITNDIQQIMGRQRLDENPWKNQAHLYTLMPKVKIPKSPQDFKEYVAGKTELTKEKIEQYWNSSEKLQINKRKENKTLKLRKDGYSDDYLIFVSMPDGKYEPVENFLVRISEQRAWDLRNDDFLKNIRILKNNSDQQQNPIVSQLEDLMMAAGCFQSKMMAYIECRQMYPNLEYDIQSSVVIDKRYHDYYNTLGPDAIRANSCQESLLRNLMGIAASQSNVEQKFRERFKVGEKYTNKNAKAIIQSIYDELGLKQTAKATDLNNYFKIERACQSIDGKIVNGLRIIE